MRAPIQIYTGGKHMRMCTGSTAGGNWSESNAALHPGLGTPESGITPFSFSCLTAGKDLLRRRVNTVAMRKSATHDSRDRPAIRRNWVGPGYYLGPEDGSIPSCASNDCRGRGIYLDSRQRPARLLKAQAVIRGGRDERVFGLSRRFESGPAPPAGRIRPFLSLFSLQNPFADSWQRPPPG